MYKPDLALNDQQWLICYKTKTNQAYVCKQMTDLKFWLLYGNNWNHLAVCKTAQAPLRLLSSKCLYKSYIYNYYIHTYKHDLALNNQQCWYTMKLNQTNQFLFVYFTFFFLFFFFVELTRGLYSFNQTRQPRDLFFYLKKKAKKKKKWHNVGQTSVSCRNRTGYGSILPHK